MLKFYYHPLSPIARRVWIALEEKGITYEPTLVDLKGEQLRPDFLALNPFHHVPVIVEGNFRLFESLAILEYLEDRYPVPSLRSESVEAQATMRMIQLVVTHEIMPKISGVINLVQAPLPLETEQHLHVALRFLDQQLGNQAFFGGKSLNLADVVVGATIPLFGRLGFPLASYPALSRWCQAIASRASFQATHPSDRDFADWTQLIRRWMKIRARRKARSQSA